MSRPVGGILSGPCPERQGRGGHPSKRPTWGALPLRGRTSSPSPTLGLAPGGVYRAGRVTPVAGALLPHLFTLTCAGPEAAIGGLLSVALSCESPRLASPAPCPAESRPSSTRSRFAVRAAATRPTHRRHQSAIRTGRRSRSIRCRPSGAVDPRRSRSWLGGHSQGELRCGVGGSRTDGERRLSTRPERRPPWGPPMAFPGGCTRPTPAGVEALSLSGLRRWWRDEHMLQGVGPPSLISGLEIRPRRTGRKVHSASFKAERICPTARDLGWAAKGASPSTTSW